MTTRDDVHDLPAASASPARHGPAAAGERVDADDRVDRSGGEDPVAVLRRLAGGRAGDGPAEPEAGGGPLRAWEAVRAGRWATTPRAALGLGLVALVVCVVVLVRAHLLAPDPAAADAGQRVAIATAADGSVDGTADGGTDGGTDGGPDGGEDGGADGAADDPVAEAASAQPGAGPAGDGSADPAPAAGATVPVVAGAAPSGAGGAGALPALVHVVGQVRAPGVVEVAAGSRVADAVAAAGGFTAEADPSALNLARAVVDGEQVVVPRPGEVPVVAPAPVGAPAAGTAPAGGVAAGAGGGPVPLDTASAAELDALPGIGPVLAQRIVEWREAHGGFASTDELGEVSGIGDKVLEQLRPLVVA